MLLRHVLHVRCLGLLLLALKAQDTSQVFFESSDSLIYYSQKKEISLYGNAKITKNNILIEGDLIKINFEKKIIEAETKDTGTIKIQIDKNLIKAAKASYNYDKNKGKIKIGETSYGEVFLKIEEGFLIDDSILLIKSGKITTCDKDTPHYYFYSTKAKYIRGEGLISGSVLPMVEGATLPFFIPFITLPEVEKKRAGVILPSYGESPDYGFFINDLIFYLPLSNYVSVLLSGTIYSRGSFSIGSSVNFYKRYYVNGNFEVKFSKFLTGIRGTPSFSESNVFFIKGTINQDAKAHPYNNITLNMTLGSSSYFRKDVNVPDKDYLTSTFSSSFTFTRRCPRIPFFISLGAFHTQNIFDSTIVLTIPDFSTRTRNFVLDRTGKITIQAVANFKNIIKAKEKELSFIKIFEGTRYATYSLPLNFNTPILKFFTISGNFSTTVKHFLLEKEIQQKGDPLYKDTLYKNANILLPEGTFSAKLTTNIYGLYKFDKKDKNFLLHIITPNISIILSTPFYSERRIIKEKVLENGEVLRYYAPDTRGIPISVTKSASIKYEINNRVEIKTTDSKGNTKKIPLLDELAVAGFYDLLRDSLTNLTARIRTNYKKLSLLGEVSIEPYTLIFDTTKKTYIKEKKIFLREAPPYLNYITFSANINSGELLRKHIEENKEISLPINFSIGYVLRLSPMYSFIKQGTIYYLTNHSIDISLALSLTQFWRISLKTGYDLLKNVQTFTTIELYRDLHCWEFVLNVVPVGLKKSYMAEIRLKSPSLKELKITRRREWITTQ